MNMGNLRQEFEDLLYDEARRLDHDRLEDWLELLHDSVRYWAPIRSNLGRGQEDFSDPCRLTHFDDDKASLRLRIQRVRTGAGYADEPPARVRHFVSNVRVTKAEDEAACVTSNFIVFKSRQGRDETFFVGYREDRWRRSNGAWKLEERMIVLDHDVVENITVLF
jgi:3-phenylpropionate/cinnamic acid dioxygenase small subunit